MLLHKEWLEEIEGYSYLCGSEAYPTLHLFVKLVASRYQDVNTAVPAVGGSSLNTIYAFEKIRHVHLKQGIFLCTKCTLLKQQNL